MEGPDATGADRLLIEGAVSRPIGFTWADLASLPESDQILDVSRLNPARKGDGVTLDALIAPAGPSPGASRVILHADKDDFHVALPLAAMLVRAIVIYRLDGGPLPAGKGGPFRVMVRDAEACGTDELDECANVKYLSRVEIA
ncbi:molybdopterin-dependent oxidoreductase [Tundrisphaera sp. TA3]|uniref:molybdopterin-dependent oxidoreductase n=1 Tax=Tundrisphaera sp. TA3 TaxID=3435775 RepID=UPI003EB8EA2A